MSNMDQLMKGEQPNHQIAPKVKAVPVAAPVAKEPTSTPALAAELAKATEQKVQPEKPKLATKAAAPAKAKTKK